MARRDPCFAPDLPAFHHWLWYCLSFVIHGLYYVEVCSFYAHFVKSFYHKKMLNFVRSFCCICGDDHMVFILQLVNMVDYVDWFVDTEPSMHSWGKSYLIMVYDPFQPAVEFSLLTFCWGLLHLHSSVIITYNYFWWYLCMALILGGCYPCRMSSEVFLPLHFLKIVWEG